MSENRLTVTQVTMHRAGDSPVFGDSAMRFNLDDEGGGMFVRVTGSTPSDPVKFDFDELPMIQHAFEMLRQAEDGEQGESNGGNL